MKRAATVFALLIILAGMLARANSVSAQDVRTGVEQLAGQIIKGAPEGRQIRVAVVDFPNLQGITSDLGRYIANRLTTRLAQSPKFFVIERQRLGQILAELKFSMSDLVDPAKAKQLGRMFGVEAIVVGTVSDLGNQVDIDARIIEIEVNRMLLGATVTISKDPTVTALLESGMQKPFTAPISPGRPPAVGTAAVPQPKELQRVEVGDFVFELKGCKISGATGTCDLTITNMTQDLRRFALYGKHYRQILLYDDLGNEYEAQRVSLGNKSGEQLVEHALAPQVPVPASVVFGSISPQASKVVVLKFPKFEFRNIPLTR